MENMQVALDLGSASYELYKCGFAKTLLYAKEAGAGAVVLPYHYPVDEATARQYVEQAPDSVRVAGIEVLVEPLGLHPYERVLDDAFDAVVALAAALETRDILVAEMPRAMLEGEAGIAQACQKLVLLSERLQTHGLRLHYCSHIEEFERVEGQCILHHMLEAIPADKLLFVPDTFWTHLSGQFNIGVLRQLAGRCQMLGLQDLAMRPPVGDHMVRSLLLDASVRTAELGMGNLGMEEIIKVAAQIGVKTLIVRQEHTYERVTFESAKRNLDYLAQMLG